tara:strand:- start:19 stop:183 length:165 start_codon:yes stop_codon:yes gene_type:complete
MVVVTLAPVRELPVVSREYDLDSGVKELREGVLDECESVIGVAAWDGIVEDDNG